jgi:hypothetical protein
MNNDDDDDDDDDDDFKIYMWFSANSTFTKPFQQVKM